MIDSYNSGVAGKGGGKMLLTFILRLFFLLVGNMHCSQVGTLGVWREVLTHPPPPLEMLTMPLSGVKSL